jgi:hypothetical protein
MSNLDVVKAWQSGVSARSMNMHTDGQNLFSYDLIIGIAEDGELKIRDYTGTACISVTTSKHVNMAVKATGATRLKM